MFYTIILYYIYIILYVKQTETFGLKCWGKWIQAKGIMIYLILKKVKMHFDVTSDRPNIKPNINSFCIGDLAIAPNNYSNFNGKLLKQFQSVVLELEHICSLILAVPLSIVDDVSIRRVSADNNDDDKVRSSLVVCQLLKKNIEKCLEDVKVQSRPFASNLTFNLASTPFCLKIS